MEKHLWKSAAALLGALTLAACDDVSDPEPEPEIASLRLVVGGASGGTVNVATNPGCAVTGGPITIHANVATTVTATFLDDANAADPIANDPDVFRLSGDDEAEPAPTPSTITWARTGPFAGTLTGTTATSGSVLFSALHIEEGHADWGPCTVPITVVP